jgi:hypothetical protein
MRKHLPPIAALLVVLVALLAAYASGYWLLLDHEATARLDVHNVLSAVQPQSPRSAYRAGGEVAKVLFWPAHQIDRWLRPSYWENEFNNALYSPLPLD